MLFNVLFIFCLFFQMLTLLQGLVPMHCLEKEETEGEKPAEKEKEETEQKEEIPDVKWDNDNLCYSWSRTTVSVLSLAKVYCNNMLPLVKSFCINMSSLA